MFWLSVKFSSSNYSSHVHGNQSTHGTYNLCMMTDNHCAHDAYCLCNDQCDQKSAIIITVLWLDCAEGTIILFNALWHNTKLWIQIWMPIWLIVESAQTHRNLIASDVMLIAHVDGYSSCWWMHQQNWALWSLILMQCNHHQMSWSQSKSMQVCYNWLSWPSVVINYFNHCCNQLCG